MVEAYINRIGVAVPEHDVHADFVEWAERRLETPRERKMFDRLAARAGITHRWSVLPGIARVQPGEFYTGETWPSTSARMAIYAREAPALAERAIRRLGPLGEITHLVVASCTGFIAPGVDQILADRLGLGGSVERTLIGFMGCYAAVAALRTARHIVRSEPHARVLVVAVELSTLHLQAVNELESLLAMMLFGDGAAAALVTAEEEGFSIEAPFSATVPDTAGLITWTVGDEGFVMGLSSAVPGHIGQALQGSELADRLRAGVVAAHAGGRSILDAVESALALPPHALAVSRAVLAENGNISSATLMFVLARLLDDATVKDGAAVAFGPGLAAEGFRFRRAT